MIPEADGLGIAVVTNASVFIAAGHEGQYDISIGLTRMLLGEEAARARYDPLLVCAAPLALWGLALALVATIIHTGAQTLRQSRNGMARPTRSRRIWVGRIVLPSVVIRRRRHRGAAHRPARCSPALLPRRRHRPHTAHLPLPRVGGAPSTSHPPPGSRRTPVAAAEAAGGIGTPARCATGPSR
jgi:hypothetical protein